MVAPRPSGATATAVLSAAAAAYEAVVGDFDLQVLVGKIAAVKARHEPRLLCLPLPTLSRHHRSHAHGRDGWSVNRLHAVVVDPPGTPDGVPAKGGERHLVDVHWTLVRSLRRRVAAVRPDGGEGQTEVGGARLRLRLLPPLDALCLTLYVRSRPAHVYGPDLLLAPLLRPRRDRRSHLLPYRPLGVLPPVLVHYDSRSVHYSHSTIAEGVLALQVGQCPSVSLSLLLPLLVKSAGGVFRGFRRFGWRRGGRGGVHGVAPLQSAHRTRSAGLLTAATAAAAAGVVVDFVTPLSLHHRCSLLHAVIIPLAATDTLVPEIDMHPNQRSLRG
mmetsp:Transcript_54052/g.161791  ORF Transcript_54052/g.161791 Transcript_54052/m.161791 type:complete len:329 (-) Transcript_54052:212-1198(-)